MTGGKRIRRKLVAPLKVVGFVIPIFMVVFATILQFFKGGTSILEVINFSAISIAWVALASAQLFNNKYPKLVLVLYHALATISILFMYNFMSPFIAFWILLTLASFIRFQNIGLVLSLIWLTFTLTISTTLMHNIDPNVFAYELSTLISVITASYVIVILSRFQEESLNELHRSRIREATQRNRLLSIINNQSDGILSVDKNGSIRVYNAASMWLVDTNQDLIGKKINNIFSLYDLDKKPMDTFKVLTSYKTNTTRDDILFKTAEGEFLRFEITFAPIRQAYGKKLQDEETDGYILIFRDVTKEKSLDDERNEFISVVSHELRTPVTVAEGALSNARVLFDSPKAPKNAVRDSIKMAHEQTLFLANLINDLSTLSRAQRDVMNNPEIIPVGEFGYRLLEKYTSDAKAKDLALDLDMPVNPGAVYTSRLYLEELMQNLIQNAIKYTQSGTVTIILERKNDKIRFAVSDTGIGISRSEREKIFEKFYRSEDYRTRETNGTGLGLYLSSQLADKMGTKLHLSSRVNHGSTFCFDLPIHKNIVKNKKTVL